MKRKTTVTPVSERVRIDIKRMQSYLKLEKEYNSADPVSRLKISLTRWNEWCQNEKAGKLRMQQMVLGN